MSFIKNRNSIIKKLLIPMIIIMIVQVFLYLSAISFSGIIEILRDNSFNILNQKIESRKNYLQNEMLQHWSNVGESESVINKAILSKLENRGLTVKDLKNNPKLSTELLNDISSDIIFMLRKNYVTGAFIILDNDSEEKTGLYFRDLDPNSNPNDNSDLLMERGPASIAQKLGIPLDTWWNNKFIFNPNNEVLASPNEFFTKPLDAAKGNKDLSYKDLGYWSKPFSLSEKDIKVITYSVPLIDNNNQPYGVMGIALSLKYLNTLLNYEEIDPNGNGVYLLGANSNNDLNFEKMMSTGPMVNKILGEEQDIRLNNKEVYNSIYEIKEPESNKIAYACTKYLNLYNSNTPFENEKWALIGIVEKDNLLYYSTRFKNLLIVSLIISSVIGIMLVIITGGRITRPIRNLAKDVRTSNPREPLELRKINISEIDELSSAIMALSTNVADSASKLSQIIKLFNMPIGAFEYKKGESTVLCTETFLEVVGIEEPNKFDKYIDIKSFEKIIDGITMNKELRVDDTYWIEGKNGKPKWIKLKMLQEDSRTFGVISDVSQEILEKQKIEYERDYDILTNILNRRAFYNNVKEKIKNDDLKIGAFIMWDLDNLKYVNDTYGHDYGDEYIRKASNQLKKFEEYGGIIGRRSGDEFYTFLYGYENKKEIRRIIKEVHKNIENSILKLPNNREIKIRISTGIAWYPDDATTFEELAKYSDFAMYKIKRTVKGNISEFNKDEYSEDSFLLSSQEDLNKLLDEELIEYAFQPIIDARNGSIFAYEALMRSQLESLRSPLHIIKLATADFRLYEIERITFFKALEGFLKNIEKFKEAKLFINSIPNQALSNEDCEKFEQLYGEHLDRLVIELLENERSNGEFITKKRKSIEKWNAKLAIDDFGSGYNNEAVLLAITPDFVKIDMGIVRGIDKDINRQIISKNLISYAKQRGIKVVAEGVETSEELEKLIELGVDYLQGYHFSKPEFIPPEISDDLINEILKINEKFN
ncbi:MULTISPECIES: EAL domain-containing protein [unclassified Clostridium]|uniref:EAL domain-containing protein n=1 Tax=unclassified Clostridium TaxID=2614128 RepID=UPI0002972852|nr:MULTISPECIES: EAL domain-containing protein [unclassified Clostridium]EKQ51342.1 MAG: diguanylate cyclase (GGDEF) domain-containing protein [Clostridium sp. Maddingley MBC34-26]